MAKLVIGKKAIIEQLKKNNVLSVHAMKIFPEIKNKCEQLNIKYNIHNDEKFLETITVNHQGIIAYIKDNDYLTEDYNIFISKFQNKKNTIVLIMDGLEDAGNVGAILRTADCFSIDGIIYKKNNQYQLENDSAIKNSQGSIYNLNILKVANLYQVISKLKEDGFWIISSTLSDDSIPLSSLNDYEKIAIVIGNEKDGVSKNILNNSDIKIKIPMYGFAQSLNVSAACAIILYSIRNSYR